MSGLTIFGEAGGQARESLTDAAAIAARLADAGVQFERWQARAALAADAGQDEVLAAYRAEVERLMKRHGFASADVVSLRPDHPKRAELRAKFLDEHTHKDFEIRFFVEGKGAFYLHIDDQVYVVLCERGDLLSVPSGTRHWFDMGEAPSFRCLRFFTTEEGWTANFTGDDIARRFPPFEHFARGAA